MSKFCKNCGSELKEGSNFCGFCGTNNGGEDNNPITEYGSNNNEPIKEYGVKPETNTYTVNNENRSGNSNNGQNINNTVYQNNAQNQASYVQNPNKYCGAAIASLVCSLIGLLCFGIPLGFAAVVAGIYALTQIKQTSEKGKGLAIAGIVIGAIDVIAAIFFIVASSIIKLMN